jgi:hypothetical protein
VATIEQLRERAAAHARQLDAVLYLKVNDLAARWGVDPEQVTLIPREQLPYLEFGGSRSRRYDPRDIEAYEERAKRGAVGGAAA